MSKPLPKEITSYDLFKTFAVLFMIIDHIGFYFYTDEGWWRIAGRMCVPVWFFLIGYASTRDIPMKLWVGSLILVLANIPGGHYILPLNILPTIIAIRLILDEFMRRALMQKSAFWALNVILVILALPTSILTEYGTLGLILAIYGYLYKRRHEPEIKIYRFY
jgi:hypothetical protein